MAQERLTLRKIREILRLKEEAGLSNRAIARVCKISNSTVGEYLHRAQEAELHWPFPEGLSEDELFRKLFPETSRESTPERPLPDWETVRQELKHKGVTLKLLWIEYRDRYPDGYGYTQFCEYYRKWAKTQSPTVRNFCTSRLLHALGQARQEASYPSFLRSLARTDLLIMDDWMRDEFTPANAQDILEVLDDRYGQAATIVASQMPVTDWFAQIANPTLADAILDRLVHNAYRLQLVGESQRKLRAIRSMPNT